MKEMKGLSQPFVRGDFHYFTAGFFGVSDEYPNGLPPVSKNLTKIQPQGYLLKRQLDIFKRYTLSGDEMRLKFDKYFSTFKRVDSAFSSLYNDYDKEVILPDTCGLSFIPKTSTDLDYQGTIGRDQVFQYDQELVDLMSEFYAKFMPKEEKGISMSFTRGKNLGWPHPIGGRQRELSDALLALHVSLALGAHKKGWSLQQLTEFLEKFHGPAFCVYAERTQKTANQVPTFIDGRLYRSVNAAARVRGIYMSPKFMVAYSRRHVKRMLKGYLENPFHTQSRDKISARVKTALSKGWRVVAIDISKFDQFFGGARGNQIAKGVAKTIDLDPTDLLFEFNTPLVTFGKSGTYRSNTKLTPILMSGVSSTTLVNGFGGTTSAVAVVASLFGVSYKESLGSYQKKWDALSWGDDLLLMLPPDIENDAIFKAYEKLGLKVDEEPTIKFLGQNYGPGRFEGSFDTGYPFARAVQQQFFPERVKTFPFNLIGYIARLELLGEKRGNAFHEAARQVWDLISPEREYFPFSQRKAVLESLMPEVEKYANKISEMDDILNVFTHGMADSDMLDELDVPSDLRNLLGLTAVDVSQPELLIAEIPELRLLAADYKALSNGDFDVYRDILNNLVHAFNLNYRSGGLLY